MILEKNFILYKEITEEIILSIEDEEKVEKLMEDRERLLKEIFQGEDLDIARAKEAYERLNLKELDLKLKDAIFLEQSKVKDELREIGIRKRANSSYNNNLGRINFLNKKI